MLVEYGVVQSSTLKPILLLQYINNISRFEINCIFFLFLDGTFILIESNNWLDNWQKAMHDLMIVKKWLDQNVLSPNVTIIKFLPIFLAQSTDHPLHDIVIHNCGDHLNTGFVALHSFTLIVSYSFLSTLATLLVKVARQFPFCYFECNV